jgi:hypothetical protein
MRHEALRNRNCSVRHVYKKPVAAQQGHPAEPNWMTATQRLL